MDEGWPSSSRVPQPDAYGRWLRGIAHDPERRKSGAGRRHLDEAPSDLDELRQYFAEIPVQQLASVWAGCVIDAAAGGCELGDLARALLVASSRLRAALRAPPPTAGLAAIAAARLEIVRVPEGGGARTVSGHSQKAVLLAVAALEGRPASCEELARAAGCSPVTAYRALAALLRARLVYSPGHVRSPSRRAMPYAVAWDRLAQLVPAPTPNPHPDGGSPP